VANVFLNIQANILKILFTDDIKYKYLVTKLAETTISDLMEPQKYPGTVSVASAIKAMK
jgi:ribosomal protein L12E/L44/L45/RPP1/RPP2